MKRLAVVVSQGQSQNPTKRQLEEDIITALMLETGVDVTVVPHLYDLKPDSTGMLALTGVSGDMVMLSWMYSRAAHWMLDRHDVRGQIGSITLTYGDDDDDESEDGLSEPSADRVTDQRPLPTRRIFSLDLRASESADAFVEEVLRIRDEAQTQVVDLMGWVQGEPSPQALERFHQPTNTTALSADGGSPTLAANSADAPVQSTVKRVDDDPGRRWYPVIDFSRCTNCMECIDFCLFGVYGVDGQETILVEQPDNCRKGCPACSRVCPENAIIFPQHKTPAIAGADIAIGGLKIDLSKLFGAPDTSEGAIDVAARERDEQLLLAGRDAVGLSVGVPKRQSEIANSPKDDLDDLIDQLDDLDV